VHKKAVSQAHEYTNKIGLNIGQVLMDGFGRHPSLFYYSLNSNCFFAFMGQLSPEFDCQPYITECTCALIWFNPKIQVPSKASF